MIGLAFSLVSLTIRLGVMMIVVTLRLLFATVSLTSAAVSSSRRR